MKTFVILLVVLVINISNASGQSFRIATYNLNWSNRRGDQIMDAIESAKPDLICFQESTAPAEKFLRRRLAETHPHFHAIGHQGRYAGERFAFASSVELKDVSFTPPSVGLFGFYSARLKACGMDVHVVNVHLTPLQIKRGGGLGDVMAAFSVTEEKHETEIGAIVDAIDSKQPTIVLGDFNSISTYVAPQRLIGLGMKDAYASLHEDADKHPTWRWPTRPLPIELRIDYIFHTDHLQTSESKVIRRDGSDHSLLVAELKRSANGKP